MEIRTIGGVRAQGRKVTGYAAVFNSAADLGEFCEVIHPGAFRATLASGQNVRALYDHQSSAILGTTQARTLTLTVDGNGLRFELDLPSTTVGNDVAELVQRGDVSGASFGFRVRPGGEAWEKRGGVPLRTLTDLDLAEITLTANPAYQDTSVAMRSMNAPRGWNADAARRWLETCR